MLSWRGTAHGLCLDKDSSEPAPKLRGSREEEESSEEKSSRQEDGQSQRGGLCLDVRLGQTGSSRNVLPRAALQGDGRKSHHWHGGGRSLCGPLAPVTDQWMRKQSEMRSRSMDSAQLVIPALPLCFIHCPLPKSPKNTVRVVPGRTKMGQRGKKKRGQEKGTNQDQVTKVRREKKCPSSSCLEQRSLK